MNIDGHFDDELTRSKSPNDRTKGYQGQADDEREAAIISSRSADDWAEHAKASQDDFNSMEAAHYAIGSSKKARETAEHAAAAAGRSIKAAVASAKSLRKTDNAMYVYRATQAAVEATVLAGHAAEDAAEAADDAADVALRKAREDGDEGAIEDAEDASKDADVAAELAATAMKKADVIEEKMSHFKHKAEDVAEDLETDAKHFGRKLIKIANIASKSSGDSKIASEESQKAAFHATDDDRGRSRYDQRHFPAGKDMHE